MLSDRPVTKQKFSSLFRHIEHLQDDRPWGSMLDAGTGINSIRWISSLTTDRWIAVTGSAGEAAQTRKAVDGELRSTDQIIQGNWADPALLNGQTFDTVLADYLMGAVEGFAPYFQTQLFSRLRPLTRHTLYITGLEPYVPTARPDTKAERLLWELGRFRDSCALMAGDMPYREYPSAWVIDQLQRSGFKVQNVKHFAVGYKDLFVTAQTDICKRAISALTDETLKQAMMARTEALHQEALTLIKDEGALRGCQNYVITAVPEGGTPR